MNNMEYECCLCGKIFTDWGNNPYPVNEDPNALCCDSCNMNIVLPARIVAMSRKRGELEWD